MIALLILVVLIATACRSQASVELGDGTEAAPVASTPDEVEVVPPAPTPTLAPGSEEPAGPEPSAGEPDAGEPSAGEPNAQDPAPGLAFAGVAPQDFDVPSGWDDPVPLDAAVAQGTLPNGMSYLVLGNDRPGSQAQLRLVVHAGSINEAPGSHGAAHFLEHMMFNGTERFPDNEIVQVLEGFGSGFGPDVNAYTSYEETVYELELPTRSTDTLQLGLDVLFEWATAATIDADAVIAERGVVREELRRAVEPLSGRIGSQVRSVLFSGTDYLGAEPIGTAETIESMTDVQLRAFYERWYRPEFMTVVAVGDFNVADTERRIQNTFVQPATSDQAEAPEFALDPGPLAEPRYEVFTDSEVQRPEVEVLWRLSDLPITTRATLRDEIVATVALSMVNNRLFEQVQGGNSVFLSAQAGTGRFTSMTRLVSASATADATELAAAFDELLVEIERARQFGFTPAELDRQIGELRVLTGQQFAESGTRQDDSLARELVEFALGREVMPTPADQQAIANEVLDSITIDDAQRFLFEVLATDPYVLVTGPEASLSDLPTPTELQAGYDSVVGFEVEQQERSESDITELMARPEPATVVDRQSIAGLDATIVTYDNGARLAFRQTAIVENQIAMQARSIGGFFAADGPEVPLLDSAAGMVGGSGFESIDVVTLDRLLSSSIASLNTSIGRAEEGLSGSAATADIETLFQLVHLQMTEPTISDLEVRQFLDRWRPLAENPATNPGLAANLELWSLRYGDSPWFRLMPTVADLDSLDQELLLKAYKDRFADAGDFVFAVVGDFNPDELVDLGARYLGTLPDSGRREQPIDRDPGVPEDNLVGIVEAGVGDQGRLRINWESPYPFTLEAAVTAEALELVVDARLRDLIREELGASYAPNAAITVMSEPKSWVDTIIEVESDPDRVEEVSQAVRDELDRVRAGDIDQQYLDLAIDQLTEDYRFFTNNQWLDLMLFHTQYPDRPSGEFRDRTAIAQRLTIADLAEAAVVVFPPTRSVEVWLVPAAE